MYFDEMRNELNRNKRRRLRIVGLPAGIIFLLFVLLIVALGSWTGDEAGWVMTQIFHKPVYLDWFWGALLNLISVGWAFPFDVIVAVVRIAVGS